MSERLKKVIYKKYKRDGYYLYLYGKNVNIHGYTLAKMWNDVPKEIRLQIIGDPSIRKGEARFHVTRRAYADIFHIGKLEIREEIFPDMWNEVPAEIRKPIIAKYRNEFEEFID